MNFVDSLTSMHLGRIIQNDAESLGPDIDFRPELRFDDERRAFTLSPQQLSTHVAVLGPTGAGKSRLLWQMMREHRRQRHGFCVIDDGDLATDFLADCAAEVLLSGNHALLKKLYWIKLNPFRMPRYDPWKMTVPEGLHPELLPSFLACWRHKRVQQFMQVTQANVTGKTDFMNQPRRQRVLTDAFTALSTAVEGRHLAVEDVFIFFNPAHKDWRRALDRCIPMLPNEITQELEMLGAFKRLGDLWTQVESSVNSLRALLGPCMKQMLSATGNEPSFDWNEAVQRGGYVIVDAHQDHAGTAENIALASLMALDLGETMLNTPKHKRKSFSLIVDEAAQFLGPLGREFGRWLRIMRKYGMPCVLAFQDLASMQLEELDLAPTILNQCGTIICFRSRGHLDNEILVRLLMTGNLKFVPLVHDVYQQRGDHKWERVQEESRTTKHDESHSTATGTTSNRGTTRSKTFTESQQESDTDGMAESKVYGPTGLVTSVSKSGSMGGGTSKGRAFGESEGETVAFGTSKSTTEGATNGWAVTVGEKLVPLPIVVHDIQKTGTLEESVADQIEKHRQHLHGLEDRHAIVLAPGMTKAVEIVTIDVPDPFQSPAAQAKAVKWIVNAICEAHDFYFVPSFDPADQDERVQRFVEGAPDEQEKKPTINEPPTDPASSSVPAPRKRTAGGRPMIDAPPGKKIPFGE